MSITLNPPARRFAIICRTDLGHHIRRPLFIVWASIMALVAWGFSTGTMMIQSGDAAVGGTKALITSEFAVAMQFAVESILFYGFFVAVAAGMTVIQDEQWRIGEVIHATPLRPGEYIWGKFGAVVAGCALILSFHLLAMLFFNHVLPNSDSREMRGPLFVVNYLKPAVVFAVPAIVFVAGVSFWIGEWKRRPVLVFLLPLAVLFADIFFLWDWSPNWLDPRLNTLLMWIDPSGFRWLNETWLKVDRGVQFYNSAAIPADRGFLISRVCFVVLGILGVALSRIHFAATLRGAKSPRTARRQVMEPIDDLTAPASQPVPLAALGMTSARPGLFAAALHVARVEFTELRSSPGLYLFIPLIILQTIGMSVSAVGFLDTPLLITPGTFAVRTMGASAIWLCLLLMLYTVETLERERSTRLAAIAYAAPVRTGSLFLGKACALVAVAVATLLAIAVAGAIVLLVQGIVGLRIGPLFLVWGLLLLPTVLVWTAFIMVVHTITQNRYTTIAAALAVLGFTGYRLLTNQINWLGNWPLWQAVAWSDISVFELDRPALFASRLLAVSAAVALIVLTLAIFRRREWDASRFVHRLSPKALSISSLRLAPWFAVPLVTGVWLALAVSWGHEGAAAKKQEKDYWRKNMATYRDARIPDLHHVDLELELFPDQGRYHSKGKYTLINPDDRPLDEILLTAGTHWEKLRWTLDDQPATPRNNAGLYLFTPKNGALAPHETAQIGFEHEGSYPKGISKKGGGQSEFIPRAGLNETFPRLEDFDKSMLSLARRSFRWLCRKEADDGLDSYTTDRARAADRQRGTNEPSESPGS